MTNRGVETGSQKGERGRGEAGRGSPLAGGQGRGQGGGGGGRPTGRKERPGAALGMAEEALGGRKKNDGEGHGRCVGM